jgi:hypothetical protein
MAAIKTTKPDGTTQYHITDADGRHVVMEAFAEPPPMPQAPIVYYLRLAVAGGNDAIVMGQQNAADLATAISNFGSNGVLS